MTSGIQLSSNNSRIRATIAKKAVRVACKRNNLNGRFDVVLFCLRYQLGKQKTVLSE